MVNNHTIGIKMNASEVRVKQEQFWKEKDKEEEKLANENDINSVELAICEKIKEDRNATFVSAVFKYPESATRILRNKGFTVIEADRKGIKVCEVYWNYTTTR